GVGESERFLPDLITELEARLNAHGLADDDIVIRMTGCPNGCARPYLAEIALVGKGPDRYNLHLGAAFDGSRMAKLYAEDLDHDAIVRALDPVLAAYARERTKGEHFGDYVIRAGFISACGNGREFHHDTGAKRRAESMIPKNGYRVLGKIMLQQKRAASANRFSSLSAPRPDLVPDHHRDVRAAEILHRADAGRRGDVDLGEEAVDHVDADEQQAALAQRRAESCADLTLARIELGRLSNAAPHHVRAQVVRLRHAVDRARELAVDQDDALVALPHRRQIALHHPGLTERRREQVVERAEVHGLARKPEHCGAAGAEQRFHHDLAVLGVELLDLGAIAGDQRRRHQIRELDHEQLFGRVAHVHGIVDHQRLGMDALE